MPLKNLLTTNILALDLGKKISGSAIYFFMTSIILPIKCFYTKDLFYHIEDIFKDINISCIVIGYPIDYLGNVSSQCFFTKKMLLLLKTKYNNKLFYLQNEILSTKEAISKMKMFNLKNKKYIDDIAASIILEDFLTNIKNK